VKNFTNGAIVFRLWRFDGSGEVLAKFQYMSDATDFAKMKANEDAEKRPKDSEGWFYLAACEAENEARAFSPKLPSEEGR
jgi:hypothetical protein